jgi:diketogulonate reductase-like aldo/keto reductase
MTGKVIFGEATISSNRAFKDKDGLEALFASLKKYGVKAIDAAKSYGNCEDMLGSVRVGSRIYDRHEVDRRVCSGSPTKGNIITTTKS